MPGPVAKFVGLLPLVVALNACTEAPPEPAAPVTDREPAFVGSAECRSCHEAEFADWLGSHHDLAMQVADESTMLGDFEDAEFEYFGTVSRFFRRGDEFVARTQDESGELRDFVVSYTYGVEPLQQYLVELANGHIQPLPFAWDTRPAGEGGQRWFHLYPDEYIGPDDPLFWTGREQNWNYMCAECHSTDVQLNYDVAADSYRTTWSEINVGCEACHGPASNHVAAARAGALSGDSALPVDLADRDGVTWRMNPDTGIAERRPLAMQAPQQPEACGRCHARRGIITSDYHYGRPLADTHRVALLTEPLYFPDGQIRDEVYVYGSFLQSRMYQAGVTCSDCHNPHSLELHTGPEPDLVCARCHLPQRFSTTEHHGHETGQVACVDCHMPDRDYMVVDPRRDHSLRVPRPDLSLVTGAPNACTMCHTDRNDEWAAGAARDWWGEPQAPAMPESGIRRATALASMAGPLEGGDAAAVERGLRDPDPLVRTAAAQVAPALPPDRIIQQLAPLLEDDVRSVRLAAVQSLAPARDYLPPSLTDSFEQAADEYRAAQLAVASRPQAHGALAEFEGRLGNIEAALEHADRAVAMGPEMALLRHSRGLLLVRADRREEALGELQQAVVLAPEVARFSYVYAVALNSLGQPDAALQVLEEAGERHPDDPEIAAFLEMLRAD